MIHSVMTFVNIGYN